MASRVSGFTEKSVDDLFLDLAAMFEGWAKHNLLFYEGDHWNQGEFWVGPRPKLSDKAYGEVMGMIERSFVSQNVIREVTRRVVNSLLGRQPSWTIMPTRPVKKVIVRDPETGDEKEETVPFSSDEANRIAEADAALTAWWDDKGILGEIKKALTNGLLTKRGPFRFFIPAHELDDEDNLIQVGTLQESLRRVYLKAAHPEQAGVLQDEETMDEAGIYVYTAGNNRNLELSYAQQSSEPGNAGEWVTILRRVRRTGKTEVVEEVELPLGGRLMVNELKFDESLISAQVRQQQCSLNRAHTMMGRNTDLGGFLERTVLNAQMPGHFETDQTTGEKHWVADDIQLGGSVVNALVGIEEVDAEGNVRHLTPSVVYRDPISPQSFIETVEMAHFAILYEVNQAFASLNTKMASADSRRQSRADFVSSILTTKNELDRKISWLLEVALFLGAWGMVGGEGRYDDLKVVANSVLNTGPLSADEVNQIIALVDKKIWPIERAMAETGIEDIEAAKAMIEEAAKRVRAMTPPVVAQNSPGTDPGGPNTPPENIEG